MPSNENNDGRSFAPLLKDPSQEWDFPTLTTYQCKNHSITDGRYRYTWYGGRDDGEELYDHDTDPLEHTNLAGNKDNADIITKLKKHLPKHNETRQPQ